MVLRANNFSPDYMATSTQNELNLYNYNNYRNYLADFYNFRKKQFRGYSYSKFSEEAKLASPNYLKLVMENKRNLTRNNLPNFIQGLGLSTGKAKFFELLVDYNQTGECPEKEIKYKKLISYKRKNLKEKSVKDYQIEFLSKWYYNAIWEMIQLKDFKENYDWISKKLKGAITSYEAKNAIDTLIKIGLVKHENNRLIQSFSKIYTSDEETSHALRNFYRKIVPKGLDSLDDAVETREFRGLTIALSKKRLYEAKNRIKNFINALNEEFSGDGEADQVYQLNLQLFSLTR